MSRDRVVANGHRVAHGAQQAELLLLLTRLENGLTARPAETRLRLGFTWMLSDGWMQDASVPLLPAYPRQGAHPLAARFAALVQDSFTAVAH